MPVPYVWLLCDYSHTTATRMVPAYTKCDVLLIKVAPDDGLIQSETCRASNEKIKSNQKNFVLLVGFYTKCRGCHQNKIQESASRWFLLYNLSWWTVNIISNLALISVSHIRRIIQSLRTCIPAYESDVRNIKSDLSRGNSKAVMSGKCKVHKWRSPLRKYRSGCLLEKRLKKAHDFTN